MKNILIAIIILSATASVTNAQSKVNQTRDVTGFNSVELKMAGTVYITQDNHFSVQVSASQDLLDHISTEVDDDNLKIWIDSKDWSKNFWKDKGDVIINITMPKINGLHVNGSGIIKVQNNILTDELSLDIHGSGEINLGELKAGKCEIGVYGSGSIDIDKAVAENIEQELEGSGDISAGSLLGTMISISLAGSGNIKFENVSSQKLQVNSEGSGDIKITKGVVNDLSLATDGSGSISASELVGKNVSAAVAGSGSISVGVLDSLDASIAGSGSVVYKGSPQNISRNISGSGSVRQM